MGINVCPPASTCTNLNAGRSLFAPVPLRAIVVDDCPDMIRTVTELLETEGNLQVIATAPDGAKAISAVRVYDPDLVVMDVNMPVMNGLAAAAEIREISSYVTILIMSSDDDPELGLAALACGADGFIAKSSFIFQCRLYLHRLFARRGLSGLRVDSQ